MKQLLILLILLSSGFAYSQNQVKNIIVEESKAVFLGKTQPLSTLIQLEATSPKAKSKFKKDKKRPDNFRNRIGKNNVVRPELEHLGPDPILQDILQGKRTPTEMIVNIDGLSSGGSPHDPTGGVGENFYLQSVNATRVGIWDKTGENIANFSMNTLWSEFGASSAGDPIILYDQEAGRWILTEFTDPANLLVAVSETGDPQGSYYAYTFSTPNFPDYPKYGLWTNHLVVTTNEAGAGNLHQYFIDRQALLAGEDATIQRVEVLGTAGSEQGFITSTPIDWEGKVRPSDDRPIVVKLNDSSWGEVDQDAIEMFLFDINYENVDSTTVENILINTSNYDAYSCSAAGVGFACVPQPEGSGLDGIPEIISNAPQYRNFGTHESMVMCFMTDITDGQDQTGVRWIEFRKTADQDWSLYQEGTYGTMEEHRFMGGIGIDKNGNISLAYNVSGDETFAGMRFTGRFADDPLGTMTFEETTIIDGLSTLNSNGRFADYSHLATDPSDELTFWFTSEYAGPSNSALTRIGAWKLGRDTFDLAIDAFNSPGSGNSFGAAEMVNVKVTNKGEMDAASYELSLYVDNVLLETNTISEALPIRQSSDQAFTSIVDMSVYRDYTFTAIVNFLNDENNNNDTLTQVFTTLAPINGAINASALNAACGSEANIPFTVTNLGADTIQSAEVAVSLNGVLVETLNWTGSLATGEVEFLNYTFTGLSETNNVASFVFTNLAGEDNDLTDNESLVSFQLFGAEGQITLEINTDEYPQETTWQLIETENNTVVAEGGPYNIEFSLFTEEFCLDPNACYSFTIYDQYGDGICCGYGEGNYSFINGEGLTVVSGTGEFGNEETITFCASDVECLLEANLEVVSATAAGDDGTIMVLDVQGGVAPYSYSIDGGLTFQDEPLFENLLAGDYVVVVQSSLEGCDYQETVVVDIMIANEDLNERPYKVVVNPNPGEGFYNLTIENHDSQNDFIHFQVLNQNGKIVQERRMGQYSGVFKTQISLLEYPSGVYYLRFLDSKISQMVKVVKI